MFGDLTLNLDELSPNMFDALNVSLNESINLQLSTSFIKMRKLQKYQIANVTKLSPFMTYIAIIKGYCAILILFIPSTYVNGGWAASSILFIFAAWISTLCVIRLIETGLKIGIYSYSDIVERALGRKAKLLSDIMIAAT